ncbi:hypothetical protein LCGC14_1357540 [marine sediment metagenome]|uniref:Uncharacterized protein n=1 Tax=marine sediment metagenome TaxID=412755 RepID=A0A0F9K906_9ZZZZ
MEVIDSRYNGFCSCGSWMDVLYKIDDKFYVVNYLDHEPSDDKRASEEIKAEGDEFQSEAEAMEFMERDF